VGLPRNPEYPRATREAMTRIEGLEWEGMPFALWTLPGNGPRRRSAPLTKLSEPSRILVVGATESQVSAAVAALVGAGWDAVGTADPWEAISLVSQCSFALIIQDEDMSGLGALDFSTIVRGDPVLQDIPAIQYSGIGLDLPRLLTTVGNTLHPRFPSDDPSPSDTRFVRRCRPAMVPAVG